MRLFLMISTLCCFVSTGANASTLRISLAGQLSGREIAFGEPNHHGPVTYYNGTPFTAEITITDFKQTCSSYPEMDGNASGTFSGCGMVSNSSVVTDLNIDAKAFHFDALDNPSSTDLEVRDETFSGLRDSSAGLYLYGGHQEQGPTGLDQYSSHFVVNIKSSNNNIALADIFSHSGAYTCTSGLDCSIQIESDYIPYFYRDTDDDLFPLFRAENKIANIAISVTDSTSPAPEPATWTMMMAGMGLVGGTMRRRRVAVCPPDLVL